MPQQKKVVFFFPAFSSQEATAPLGILAVSTPLLRAGYQVRIIDSTITPELSAARAGGTGGRALPGVSLVTGPMIRETVQIARAAKSLYPDLPVVLGGWHPSLLPDQTLAAEYVDVVVVGQGEDALLEVVQHLEARRIAEGHRGRRLQGGRPARRSIRRAPLRPIREMPPKAYHLADFDAYQRVCGRRWAMYTSSLACPYNCGYCTNDGVYGRKWNALEAGAGGGGDYATWSAATAWSCCGSWTTISWSIASARWASPRDWCDAACSSTGAFRRRPTW